MNLKSIVGGAMLLSTLLPVTWSSELKGEVNPFMAPYNTPYDIPPFDKIKPAHYIEAYNEGLKQARADLEQIVNNPEEPTFENTILAMDKMGVLLERVSRVFNSLTQTDITPELSEINDQITPLVGAYEDEISMNDKLFKRIKTIYDNRDKLNLAPDQKRMVENTYTRFTRNGALLSEKDKETLKQLNTRLSELYLQFNKNLLAATNEFEIVVEDENELSGLSEGIKQAALEAGKKRGHEGKYVFTLHAPSRLPLLKNADNRELREKMYKGYSRLASSGKYDNRPVINEILKARSAKAKLLGYPDYATYMTAKVMAGTPEAAQRLMQQMWGPTVKKVNEEVAEMQQIVDRDGLGFKIAPWDYYYYSDKVRKEKYDIDENQLRPYFQIDSVRNGIFTMANKLYGVTFTEIPDAPKYNPEVKVYDMRDANGEHVAVFMTDYHPRASKRQGAWASKFKASYIDEEGNDIRPINFNVGNFTAPTTDVPSQLSLDEVETMFHEFGHGLHGMLSRARYKSQSGTAVDRDFVELPSQIHEHWAFEPEVLKMYAHHYQTGEVIPDELIEKLEASSTHGSGFHMAERITAAWLDMQYGLLNPDGDIDIDQFEQQVVADLGAPSEVEYRYHSPYFKHVFGGEQYASGYYTYMWAEVLDCDGFDLFAQNGIFDKATADSFRENVLEMGGSEDPMTLFVRFRGQQPTPDALMRKYGLDPNAPKIDLKISTKEEPKPLKGNYIIKN